MNVFPLDVIKKTILESQRLSGLEKHHTESPTETILRVMERIRALQIDTLQMVRRSHYVALWSRIDNYSTEILDELCYGKNKKFIEYWYHAACIIPISEFTYRKPHMKIHEQMKSKRWNEWGSLESNRALAENVFNIIQNEGPQKTSNFNNSDKKRGPWWDWKPQKRALEYLYDSGKVVISDRVNFQKVYDETEKHIPKNVISKPVSMEESILHDLEKSLIATGICSHQQVADYTHMKRNTARPHVIKLIDQGLAVEIRGINSSGHQQEFLIHKSNLELLQKISEGEHLAQRTTLLSPFDSLFWARGRDVSLFGFNQVLECYKPKHMRKWGYFSLPILHNGNLVGRLDPKLDRVSKTMFIRSIHLEKKVNPTERLIKDTANALKRFLEFHEVKNIAFDKIGNQPFNKKLEGEF